MDRGFAEAQRGYFRALDAEHFRWQTEGAHIAATEAALIAAVDVGPGERLLEIGCGEGANLHHLAGRGARLFGVDFAAAKARFAAARTGAATACGDAERLPFADGAFDAVLVRDLLHHVPDRAAVLDESLRVLRPGGRITAIEPNAWNPLIAAQAAAIAEERGMRASTASRLTGELKRAGFEGVRVSRAQPLPVSRLLLHYRFGAPSLGGVGAIAWALRRAERAFGRLPAAVWMYLVGRGRRP